MTNWLSPAWRRRIAAWCPVVAFGVALSLDALHPELAAAGGGRRGQRPTFGQPAFMQPEFCPPPIYPSDVLPLPAKPAEPGVARPGGNNAGQNPGEASPNNSNSSGGQNADPNANTNPNANADPNAANNQPPQPDPTAAPPSNAFQAASNTNSAAPNMIGDFFGPTGSTIRYQGFLHFVDHYKGPGPTASVVGRQKIQENDSPIPMDRVFANYSYFDNVPLIYGGAEVNRLTLGFEKTIFDGDTSIEVRAPMASTVDSNAYTGVPPNDSHGEFGNLHIALKHLLYRDDTVAVSAGLGITIPTADDIRIFDSEDNVELIRFENHSTHLMPFFGVRYTPGGRFFAQTLVQFDFDANGNPVKVFNSLTESLQTVGRANDGSYVYVGQQIGYWLQRPGIANGGIAAVGELQWTRSMRNPDEIRGENSIGERFDFSSSGQLDIYNLVLGLNAQLGNASNIMVGYALPMGGGQDQQFDGELRLVYNLYFGGNRDRLIVNR